MNHKNIYLILSLSILSFTSLYGNIQELKHEFIKNNKNVLESEYNIEQLRLQYDALLANKGITLNLGVNHLNQDLFQTTPFATSRKADTIDLSLSKAFTFGGTLTAGQQIITENVTAPALPPALFSSSLPPKRYGVYNFISHQQELGPNFFGRQFRSKLRLSLINVQVKMWQYESQNEQLLLGFYHAYVQSQLYKSLIELQKSAIKRGEERHQLIQKRVNDGLLDKVDLMASQTAVLGLNEEKSSEELAFNSALEKLSGELHREVSAEEIAPLNMTTSTKLPPESEELGDNKQLLFLGKEVQYQQENVDHNNFDFYPRVTLNTQYRSNAYDQSFEASYNKAMPGHKNREWLIGIQMSWPLGFEIEKVEQAKQNAELLKKQMLLKKQALSLKETQKKLRTKLSMLQKLIESAKKREEYAKTSLSSYQQLYYLGKRDVDTVIRAEETLIQTQKSLTQYFAEWMNSYADYNLLRGTFTISE